MKNKKLLSLVFLVAIVIALLAVLVYALAGTISSNDISFGVGDSPSANNFTANISGVTNLTVTLRTNASFFTNATINWFYFLTNERAAGNFSLMKSTTIQNVSRNSTIFHNATFNTAAFLFDGVYVVNVSVFNASNVADNGYALQETLNGSLMNITVDNTKPNGTVVMGGFEGSGQSKFNFTRSNYSTSNIDTGSLNVTFNVSVREQLSGVKSVFFEFFNRNQKMRMLPFNISGSNAAIPDPGLTGNRSGVYSTTYNISNLTGGTWELRAYITDQAGNINITSPVIFIVNGNLSVTINSSNGMNYSGISDNQTFKVTVFNDTVMLPADRGTNGSSIWKVLLVFDNATGSDFNVTMAFNNTDGLGANHMNFTASYNVSNLVEGNNGVRVFAEDAFGNFNFTENISFVVDKTNPTVSVTCTPSEAKVGETVSCTCTATDALSGLKSKAVFTGGGTSESTTADSVGSKTTSVCSVLDRSGNKGSKTSTFTVVEETVEGSGAGGSSGGTSSGSSGSYGQRSWSSLSSGEVAVVDVTDKSVGITKVSFGVTQTSYGGWVRVSKRDGAPLTAEAFSKKMYKVVEITTSTALKETAINNRNIEFRVEKSWLQSSGLAAGDVTLYRLVNKEWVALATTVGQDDGSYVHYSATTPGFSYFLVGEKGQAGPSAPAKEGATEEKTPGTAAPAEEGATEGEAVAKEGISTTAIVAIVLVILAVAAVLWYFFGRNKEE